MAGDIAVPSNVGLKDVTTGETLCDIDFFLGQEQDDLEKMDFLSLLSLLPWSPKTKADQEKWVHHCAWITGISTSAKEDPSFRVETDEAKVRPNHYFWYGRACTSMF